MAAPNNTIIIGAGIIGLSTAHYLSQSPRTPPQTIHLVEAAPSLFASASGYAAGFLARDWYGPALAPLGALSFDLHKELAEKHDGRAKWGYMRSTGTSMAEDSRADGPRGEDWLREGGSRAVMAGEHEFEGGEGPAWLTRRRGDRVDVISEDGSTAQVDPLRLCKFLMQDVQEKGVRLHQPARAVSVSKDMRGELATVRIATDDGVETDIPCTRLVITAGAWSPQVFSTLFPSATIKLPVSSLAGHSIVVRSPRWSAEHEDKGCHAVFATDPSGFSPEVFSRTGGEIYLAGLNDAALPLPKLPTDAKPDAASIEKLKKVSKRMLGLDSGEDDLQILREGLCFRPVTPRGNPIIGRIDDKKLGGGFATRGGGEGGVFLAAGHGPWGISNSLGTGKVLAELVEGQKTSADIRRLAL